MKLRFQKRALHQIDTALSFIAERSPQGAANVEARLTAFLDLLQQQPQIGFRTSAPGVRRMFLAPYPYLIDYRISRNEIVIQRFRHAARRRIE